MGYQQIGFVLLVGIILKGRTEGSIPLTVVFLDLLVLLNSSNLDT